MHREATMRPFLDWSRTMLASYRHAIEFEAQTLGISLANSCHVLWCVIKRFAKWFVANGCMIHGGKLFFLGSAIRHRQNIFGTNRVNIDLVFFVRNRRMVRFLVIGCEYLGVAISFTLYLPL